jgi:hypothetical protein
MVECHSLNKGNRNKEMNDRKSRRYKERKINIYRGKREAKNK